MANELSTCGIEIKYAVETTAGTKPSTGFVKIPNIKNIDGMNAEPSQYEVTDLSDLEYKRYIPALKDMGGNIELTVNLTPAFKTIWETLVSASETAKASGKATWFEFVIPGFDDAFWVAGIPNDLGFPNVGTDSVLEGNVYITPNQVDGWATKV